MQQLGCFSLVGISVMWCASRKKWHGKKRHLMEIWEEKALHHITFTVIVTSHLLYHYGLLVDLPPPSTFVCCYSYSTLPVYMIYIYLFEKVRHRIKPMERVYLEYGYSCWHVIISIGMFSTHQNYFSFSSSSVKKTHGWIVDAAISLYCFDWKHTFFILIQV